MIIIVIGINIVLVISFFAGQISGVTQISLPGASNIPRGFNLNTLIPDQLFEHLILFF
jgi:hypothetical protein